MISPAGYQYRNTIGMNKFYRNWGKRGLDLVIAVPGVIILSPLYLILSLMVMLFIHGSPVFRQRRPGYRGEPFTIYKFRTMTDKRDECGNLISDRQRLNRVGRFLRRISFDELPELINVIKGDMSLIGPRPLLLEYLDRYTSTQIARHRIKPGITGWAQVNGRNLISWEDKFRFDIWYVNNLSLSLDMKILCMTFINVIKRKGINKPGHATTEIFRGTGGQHGTAVQEVEITNN